MSHVEISWDSERIDHLMLADLENAKLDILMMCLADIMPVEYEIPNAIKKNGIRYLNTIVPGTSLGSPSNISIAATAMLMCSFGDFPIPPEIMEYINEEFENGRVNERNFPQGEEVFERGKNLIIAFMEKGIPYYSACAIAGATWVECGWNVHVANQLELNNGGVGGTGGWSGCGEGLFGLTFWSQKSKVIDRLLLPGFKKGMSADDYEKANKHLCDCTEEEWVDILATYLDICVPKHKEVLCNEDPPENDDDRTAILCSGYLFKAAGGLDPTFDNVKETTERYMRTHTQQAQQQAARKGKQSSYQAYNGFAFQIFVSIMLDKYLHNGDLDDLTSGSDGSPVSSSMSSHPRKSNTDVVVNKTLFNKVNSSVEYDESKDIVLDEKGSNQDLKLTVRRGNIFNYKGDQAVFGKLYVNGEYWCDTAERRLVKSGTYDVAWRPDQGCTKTGRRDWMSKGLAGNIMYKFATYSKGFVPLIKGVKGRSGIRIHEGTGVAWSEGCLVLGKLNSAGNELTNSWDKWKSLYDLCHNCNSCKITYINTNDKVIENQRDDSPYININNINNRPDTGSQIYSRFLKNRRT